MKRLFYLLLLLFTTTLLSAQENCNLNSFAYEIVKDGEVFYFKILRPGADVLSQYDIFVNNEGYPDSSGLVGPIKADCQTIYTLTLRHQELDFCGISATVGSVCPGEVDCRIGEIAFAYPECNPNGVVMVELDFEHANTSDFFFVKGNGENYGEFRYEDLPISVGPIVAQCDQEYEFVVIDGENPDCENYVDGIVICCPDECRPPEFEIVSKECTDETLFLKLALIEDLLSTNLAVRLNDQFIDFEMDGPYIYIETTLPLNSVLQEIEVCYVGFTDVFCCASQTFFTEGCGMVDQCLIYNVRYTYGDCDPNEETFVKLDFDYLNTSDSFIVVTNNASKAIYAYSDLPIEIGPFEPACDIVNFLEIRDAEVDSCSTFVEDLIICCHDDCLEPIFEVVEADCSDDYLFAKLELIHPLLSDEIRITINGSSELDYEWEGNYLYIKYPLINTQDVYIIELCYASATGIACCYSYALELPNCSGEQCRIGSLQLEPYVCSDATVSPYFILDFEYANVGQEGFSVKGNGRDYGDFKYEELPIRLEVEDNCDIFYEFVVIDNQFDCSSVLEFGPYCCNDQCSFRAKEIRTRCEDGILTEVAFFLEEDTDEDKVHQVYINGEFIGETDVNNVFLEFETQIPLEAGDQTILTICDIDCCVEYRLDVEECLPPTIDCRIDDIVLDEIRCGDEGGSFYLNFEHKGTNSEYFDLYSIFGYFGSYPYAELPVKIEQFPSANVGVNVLFVCDQGSLCCQAHVFNSPFCSPTGSDGEEDVTSSVKDIQDFSHTYIVQNPIAHELLLDSPVSNNVYHLIDGSGQRIRTIKSSDKRTVVDTSELKGGIYFVQIQNGKGTKVEKLIIAK